MAPELHDPIVYHDVHEELSAQLHSYENFKTCEGKVCFKAMLFRGSFVDYFVANEINGCLITFKWKRRTDGHKETNSRFTQLQMCNTTVSIQQLHHLHVIGFGTLFSHQQTVLDRMNYIVCNYQEKSRNRKESKLKIKKNWGTYLNPFKTHKNCIYWL